MSDVQRHVSCCVSVKIDGCVEVQNRNRNILRRILNSGVRLQVPQVCVIHHKESMVQGPVEECDIHCKPILDFVGLVAGAVEVERCEISCHIESDINSLGDGDMNVI